MLASVSLWCMSWMNQRTPYYHNPTSKWTDSCVSCQSGLCSHGPGEDIWHGDYGTTNLGEFVPFLNGSAGFQVKLMNVPFENDHWGRLHHRHRHFFQIDGLGVLIIINSLFSGYVNVITDFSCWDSQAGNERQKKAFRIEFCVVNLWRAVVVCL